MAKPLTAEQAIFLLHDVYLGTLKMESGTTKKLLEAVPSGRGEYRPDPASRTAMELTRHIAAADNRFVETAINGVFDTNPAMIPEKAKTPAEIAAWYEERYAKNIEALTEVSGEQLAKIVDFRGMFQWPAVKFLMFGLHHTIHHRGQLSSYLRCMGAKVPAIYGEATTARRRKRPLGKLQLDGHLLLPVVLEFPCSGTMATRIR